MQNFSTKFSIINQWDEFDMLDGCRNFLTDAVRLFHSRRVNRYGKQGEVIIVNNYCAAIILSLARMDRKC